MTKPLVVILIGSKADLEHAAKISDACKGLWNRNRDADRFGTQNCGTCAGDFA